MATKDHRATGVRLLSASVAKLGSDAAIFTVSNTVNALHLHLLEVDPNSQAQLEAVLKPLSPEASIDLLQIVDDPSEVIQNNASWLLLRGIESGWQLTAEQWETWQAALKQLSHWGAMLHFCQAYHHASAGLMSDARGILEDWKSHKKPFIRAWAISALVEDAKRSELGEDRIAELISAGMSDPAASVRARMRNVVKSTTG